MGTMGRERKIVEHIVNMAMCAAASSWPCPCLRRRRRRVVFIDRFTRNATGNGYLITCVVAEFVHASQVRICIHIDTTDYTWTHILFGFHWNWCVTTFILFATCIYRLITHTAYKYPAAVSIGMPSICITWPAVHRLVRNIHRYSWNLLRETNHSGHLAWK